MDIGCKVAAIHEIFISSFFLGRWVADYMFIWKKGSLTSWCVLTQKTQSNLCLVDSSHFSFLFSGLCFCFFNLPWTTSPCFSAFPLHFGEKEQNSDPWLCYLVVAESWASQATPLASISLSGIRGRSQDGSETPLWGEYVKTLHRARPMDVVI